MIVMINGAFAASKTTIAELLVKRLYHSMPFNCLSAAAKEACQLLLKPIKSSWLGLLGKAGRASRD